MLLLFCSKIPCTMATQFYRCTRCGLWALESAISADFAVTAMRTKLEADLSDSAAVLPDHDWPSFPRDNPKLGEAGMIQGCRGCLPAWLEKSADQYPDVSRLQSTCNDSLPHLRYHRRTAMQRYCRQSDLCCVSLLSLRPRLQCRIGVVRNWKWGSLGAD